jgi:hypothetical protein
MVGSVRAPTGKFGALAILKTEHNDLATDFEALLLRVQNRLIMPSAVVADGTTAGKIKTTAACDYQIGNAVYTKAATDDLWDLSAETDTGAAAYRAYYLYLDAAGAATFEAGSDTTTAALAIASLGAPTATKSVIGLFVAGLSCNFDDAGGLDGQGDYHQGGPVIYTQTGLQVVQ